MGDYEWNSVIFTKQMHHLKVSDKNYKELWNILDQGFIVGFCVPLTKFKWQKVCHRMNIFQENVFLLKDQVGGWYNLSILLISGLRYDKTKPEMF